MTTPNPPRRSAVKNMPKVKRGRDVPQQKLEKLFGRDGNMFKLCPNCGHGVTDNPSCCNWCGWPNLDEHRASIRDVIKRLDSGGK